MALVRQQKLLSFTAGLAVAGATYVSTQVRTQPFGGMHLLPSTRLCHLSFWTSTQHKWVLTNPICPAEVDMVFNIGVS